VNALLWGAEGWLRNYKAGYFVYIVLLDLDVVLILCVGARSLSGYLDTHTRRVALRRLSLSYRE
jgi:hypothetical protein